MFITKVKVENTVYPCITLLFSLSVSHGNIDLFPPNPLFCLV